jgi:hypothetical protein
MKNSKLTFFNLGNADTTLIRLKSGKIILWDFANMNGEKHCDLPKEIRKRIQESDFDVVCFTHADEDHVKGMSNFFFLEHAEKYQEGNRKKIDDLWVPAALFLESRTDYCDDAKILQAEAKHRLLKLKKRVKVFSRPDLLKKWIEDQGVSFESVKHLIVDAGQLVPGWRKESEGVEFFVHSPYKGHVTDTEEIDRNNASIIVQAKFNNTRESKIILGSDADSENIKLIVKMSRRHKNEDKLKWDLIHLFHHCSYKSLDKDNKGVTKTTPIDEVKWLFETQGQENCIIISPSDPIPTIDTDQPPHRQAFAYYKEDVVSKKNGSIKVTMEEPSIETPGPLDFQLEDNGISKNSGLDENEKRAGAEIISKKSISSGNWGT